MRGFAGFLAWLFLVPALAAQNALPEGRYLVTRDVDFYGADLEALFDTDLSACIRACSANSACQAFTFNARSNACFPKSTVSDRTPYEGAVSAEKIATGPDLITAAPALAANLDFLPGGTMARAANEARDLGFRHPWSGQPLDALLQAARTRAAAGDPTGAMRWTGIAVSLSDRSDLWLDYARYLMAINPSSGQDRRRYRDRGLLATVNAYLRGTSGAARANALVTMAQTLEAQGRGRAMISALRLALTEAPRQDIETALDAAIAKHGFRVTATKVESDAAQPRICLEFSEPLVKAGVDYEPFVRLPSPDLTVEADGAQLCVDGVAHGARYQLTIRAGLPAESGETLHKDYPVTQYVRDRRPQVRFPGRSYVLPKTADAALPVETVNVTGLDLRLRRISDRNLLRAVQDGYFGRPLSQYQDQRFGAEIAENVWTGTAEITSELNRDMTTRLPLRAAIAGQPAGIYALTARVPGADPYDDPGATQWFVLSDLGLSSLQGNDGLHVNVRALSDAAPRAGVTVTLVSRANAVLGEVETGADGYALFAPGLVRGTGGAAPAMILAESGVEDIGFLSLTEPAFDLSDRGVQGRPSAGSIDVFLTTDRGAYRAGETIFATVLARDPQVKALGGVPLIAILNRPDGVEHAREVSVRDLAGGHVFSLPLSATVPRGTWRLQVKSDPDGPLLASQTLLVEDFLPERIDFDLSLPDAPLRAGDTPPLTISARYLFGAPGADLPIDGEVVLRPIRQSADWPGFLFGRYDAETRPLRTTFGGQRTGPDGQASVPVTLPLPETSDRPMEAQIIARLSEGSGRPVERNLTVPVQPAGPVIGLRPLFDDVVSEGGEAAFRMIGLSPDLTPQPMRVRWTLNRVETRYEWYQLYGNWNWEPTTRRTRIATGEVELDTTPLEISQPVEWGEYELVAERLDGTYAETAMRFYAGWYAPADASSTPDTLELSLDKPSYRPGETAQLRIVPRHAGTALIQVVSDRLIERHAVEVEAGEALIPLDVTEEWGKGAYVSATVLRAMDVPAGQMPARSLGIAHAAIDPGDAALSVALSVPDNPRPRQDMRVRVSVSGGAEGEMAWVTLAAVDLGILNLTGFQSPDPQGHYFGQRQLGMEMRDVYGRLIDGMNGALGVVRSGGDAGSGMRRQSPPPTQNLMAVFSGPVEIGPEGETFINVPVSAFNGTVRLMSVAWSDTGVGQATTDVVLRDPVVVTASLPRVLAPGDSSRLRLELAHAEGPAGEMQVTLTAPSALRFAQMQASVTLIEGGRATLDLPVEALEIGDHVMTATLTTPAGRTLSQKLTLPVRVNDPAVATTRRFSLGADETFTLDEEVFADLRAGTGSALISAGPLARFDAPGLLSQLDRYPYGCTEQVTSQAMPLLYLSSVAEASGLGTAPKVDAQIAETIAQILTRQASNGAFGLWRAQSGEFWLDAYVGDFLSRARAQGHEMPDRAFRLAMDNLRNRVNFAPDFDRGGEDIAYALMVLAREGAASMGDLRYYADVKGDAFATPLAAAQLGAALASYGDQTRADRMFARAVRLLLSDQDPDTPVWRADFGTSLRDAAGVLTLAAEAGSQVVDTTALSRRIAAQPGRRSTQEAAWSLLAAHALIDGPGAEGLEVNGAPVSSPFVRLLEAGMANGSYAVTSSRPTDITLTTIGVPLTPPGAGGTGFSIERSYFDLDGQPLDPAALGVGQRFVTVLEVVPFEETGARLIIDDPLPGGVEIDNPNLLRAGDVRALDWLEPSRVEHAEFRSDRFVAAVDLRGSRTVRLAYVARAVTPGAYHHPAASVEDMYRPRFRARTATGRVVVTE
ncbi:alpha-2-macroglobulin family protein [Thalassococcus sp. S3]|uniref:alpha-2-macroglobulin family protein n=1 Tax=Thalassococcus sp. S3 TaxID=2017482 RepID=UPI0010243021|nr:alpha-2-macroglobulin family protein [Thalassococcus sp. S3]QBF29823.1 PAN domain-containing protein [Thalassococcus sp. S3]